MGGQLGQGVECGDGCGPGEQREEAGCAHKLRGRHRERAVQADGARGSAAFGGALAHLFDGETRRAVFGGGRLAVGEARRGRLSRNEDRRTIRPLLVLLPLVTEPHSHLFREEVELLSDELDGLPVRAGILLEEFVQGGLCLRREDGALLSLPRGDRRQL